MRRLLIALLLVLSGAVFAEGPGTRIRSGSQVPRTPQTLPPEKPQTLPPDKADACARLRDEARKRCLGKPRSRAPR